MPEPHGESQPSDWVPKRKAPRRASIALRVAPLTVDRFNKRRSDGGRRGPARLRKRRGKSVSTSGRQ
eukprot:2013588-Pyramimonas_sp.AAC.4